MAYDVFRRTLNLIQPNLYESSDFMALYKSVFNIF